MYTCISILYSRIGDTSLQEKINTENVTKVNSYLEKYEKIFGSLGNYLIKYSNFNMLSLLKLKIKHIGTYKHITV